MAMWSCPYRCAVTGALSSVLLIDNNLNWYYLSVVIGVLGLVWAVGLRALALHSLQNHKTRYKLSEGKRYTAVASGSSRGGTEIGAKPNSASLLGAGGISTGGSGVGANVPARDSSKQRLKLDIHPVSMVTSCSQLPMRNLIKQPPVL